jgi:hypothetical protein
MRKYFLFLALAALPLPAQKGEQLFNGKDLEGWKFIPGEGGTQGFVVENVAYAGGQGLALVYEEEDRQRHVARGVQNVD